MTKLLLIAAPTLPALAALAILVARPLGERPARWAVRTTTASFAAALVVAVAVGVGDPISAVVEQRDHSALFGFYASQVSVVLGLLTTGVGLVVQSFARRALRGDPRERRFFVLASLLTAATTTVAFAATLGLLCLSWVVAGMSIAALVGHRAGWEPAQRAARRTRDNLRTGDAALLIGVVIAARAVGEIDLRSPGAAAAQLATKSVPVLGVSAASVVAVLLVLAAISRSALVPLHAWLPATVGAPTPVSALLHAGVVNGGGVLLVRLAPVMGFSPLATHLAFAAGAVTACYATAVMLVRSDIKGSLAWSTAGQMGFMTVQVAVGALPAALLHIVGHGMYKASLFLGSGGAITAHLQHRHRPDPPRAVPRGPRLVIALVVPAAALGAAYAVIDPHLTASARLLVTVFALATAARATDGWLRSAPFPPAGAIATATLGAVAGIFAYIGGLAALEEFITPALPGEVDHAVSWVVLAATLVAIALAGIAVWFRPGEPGRRQRALVYALVLSTAAPTSRRSETVDPTVDRTPRRHDDRPRIEGYADILVDVAQAADVLAPLWPLTSFVAVNPLLGLQHLSFDEATAAARRWLGARTHLSLAEFRAAHRRDDITDGDLRRAIVEVDWELASQPSVQVGDRTVDAVEVVRLDLLVGPEDADHEATSRDRTGAGAARVADELVARWCAAYIDERGVAWAMPQRDRGFFQAWRALAPHDRRLRRLVGPVGMEWLSHLPDRPAAALGVSLDALGVADSDRVDALREHLGRIPGWAGYAHWQDEWAPPDDHRHQLRLLDLVAVHVAATAAAAHGAPARQLATPPNGELLDARTEAVVAALGGSADDPVATSAVQEILQQVPQPVRSSMWLAAHEGNFRDRLLGLLNRPDPGSSADRPDVQAAFCIDARSEGLRRHLESFGPYDTIGFAGFFGVPMRWRPFGSNASHPCCPVLVTPNHEVTELPLGADEAAQAIAVRRAAGAGHDAFHAAKDSLVGPFALAEAAGYLLGPVSAARTLAPSLVHRTAELLRPRGSSLRTRPAVASERDPGSGLALEERAFFAEAIVKTMGLTRFARLLVLCGHGSQNINNPHSSSYDCGACGGAPGGPSARVAAAILNDPAVRAELVDRGITVPDDTYVVAAQHDTVSDVVTVLDREDVPDSHERLVAAFERDVALAGARLAQERAQRLPGNPAKVRARGRDWAQVRPEWGLAGNAAFVVGPRSITADLNLACRVFLHNYDADADPDGLALETILTAPLVVGQWISAQYYFSTVDPDVFGAGDKMLHNPVGGIGVLLGEGSDLQVGLPIQALAVGPERMHEPLRLLAVVQAPIECTESIIQRNQVLQELIGGQWITMAGRSHGGDQWSIRTPSGAWEAWSPADASIDRIEASLEVR